MQPFEMKKKFGRLKYLFYLCIGNTEVTKTLLLKKG